MQVLPIKPTLKAPGAKCLKLTCDEPLSNFAFNFNLRRYEPERVYMFFIIECICIMAWRCRLNR